MNRVIAVDSLTDGQRAMLDAVANQELAGEGMRLFDLLRGQEVDPDQTNHLARLVDDGLVRHGEHGPVLTARGISAWHALHDRPAVDLSGLGWALVGFGALVVAAVAVWLVLLVGMS